VTPSRIFSVSASDILLCTIKSRRFLLALAHPSNPGKRAVKRLCVFSFSSSQVGIYLSFGVFSVVLITATLRCICGHYIFALCFLLSSSIFFARLFSAVADWMSTLLPHIVWP